MFCFKCGATLNGYKCSNCNSDNTVTSQNNYIKSTEIENLLQGDIDYAKVTEKDELPNSIECVAEHNYIFESNKVEQEEEEQVSIIEKEDVPQPQKTEYIEPVINEENSSQKKTSFHEKSNHKILIAIVIGIILFISVGICILKTHSSPEQKTNHDNISNSEGTDSDSFSETSSLSTETTTSASADATTSTTTIKTEEITQETQIETQTTTSTTTTTKSTSKYILTTTTEKLVVTKPTEPVTSTIPQTTNNSTSTTTTQYIPPTTEESTTEPETTQPETSIPTIEIPTTTETMQDTSISTEPSIVPTAAQVSLYEVLIPKYAVICIQSEKLF